MFSSSKGEGDDKPTNIQCVGGEGSETQSEDFPGGPVVRHRPGNAGPRVPCLVGALSPMCLGAAKPVHNYGARVPELEGPSTALGTPMPQ